jgi:membrane-bound serine protease (ClpP class)
MRIVTFCLLLLLASGTMLQAVERENVINDRRFRVMYAQLDSGISPAQVDFLESALEDAGDQACDMLLLRLNTPGGLGESMRKMVQLILGAQMPVAVWVGPAGARASSAGVFIVAASDIAAMAPSTNIGSASPVSVGGDDMNETMAAKVKNDLSSLLRGVAKSRGRNVDWYMEAVEKAVSITGEEAVMLNVVDHVADTPQDLLMQLSAKGIDWRGRTLTFNNEDVRFVDFDPGARYSILAWLLDPQIAYFLLLGGLAGLFFELSSPGAIFPGVFGGICLLLGLYALSILPTNVAGLLLILFSMVLFVMEIYITSFGLLGIAGLVAFFIGSTILYRTEFGFGGLPFSTVLGTSLGLAAVFVGAGMLIGRAHFSKPAQGMQTLVGQRAKVRNWQDGEGQVFIRGEVWKARIAAKDSAFAAPEEGEELVVKESNGLVLLVDRDDKKQS